MTTKTAKTAKTVAPVAVAPVAVAPVAVVTAPVVTAPVADFVSTIGPLAVAPLWKQCIADVEKGISTARILFFEVYNKDLKLAQKALLVALKENFPGFKSNGDKKSPGKSAYDCIRKHFDNFSKEGAAKKVTADYNAQARLDSFLNEMDKHEEFRALVLAHFGHITAE